MSFTAPVDPTTWTFAAPGPLAVPAGLRYAGRRLPALLATRSTAGPVRAPATGIVRAAGPGGSTVVELQVNPFRTRDAVRQLPMGAPTFYLVFEPGATLVTFAEGDQVDGGETLATATAVSILCAGQDRLSRDPALWTKLIADAGAPMEWAQFAAAVAAQTAGADPPVLLLDHTGAPLETGQFDITAGSTTATASLVPGDGGDLQRTVARMHLADPASMPLTSVFAAGPQVGLRPVGTDPQLAAVETATDAASALEVTAERRHITFTDLQRWFAPQFATPVGLDPARLADYSRGNVFTPFVNGTPYYDDLFRRIRDAAQAGSGGLHLVGGWKTYHDDELTEPDDPAPDVLGVPTTLLDAVTLLSEHGAGARILSPQFFQLDPGSSVETTAILTLTTLFGALAVLSDVDPVRSDGTGVVILALLFLLSGAAIDWFVTTDGRVLEPNRKMLTAFAGLANVESVFGPHPATTADNPNATALTGFPFDQMMQLVDHFGFYHQKFAVVGVGTRRYAYCGGIDINPNRLDDARHLKPGPYHDVHAKIEGPAAHDVELTFQQRWSRDGGGTGLAFEPVEDDSTVGSDVVQVARTYFRAADPSRRLDFAPDGDRTILDTMVRAIGSAREFIYIEDQYFTPPAEYCDALADKVASGDIGALVIALPSSPDQPFGEVPRTAFVDRLHAADPTGEVVRIGYPRRHYTLADNDLRASSGRLVLMEALDPAPGVNPTIVLGPKSRLPLPPFWVAVEGELMYVYNESATPSPDPTRMLAYDVLRGGDTRLLRGGPVTPASGPRTRRHEVGAAATVVSLSGIYVHTKMMIVDDVFVGIGSANLNRRGLLHDGEITAFSVPQALRASPDNPVAALRRELWAEMLDLPIGTADALLQDPIAAARLFDRSPLLGNRFTEFGALPVKLMWDATGGDAIVMNVLRALLVDPFVIMDHAKVFDAIIDPTSAVEHP